MHAPRRSRALGDFTGRLIIAFSTGAFALAPLSAAPLTPAEIATLCAQVDGPSHCGRLIEEVQLKRLPNLAVRDGASLKISLYPAGTATLADTEALNG